MWVPADPVTNPTANQELVGVEFTDGGIKYVTLVISTTLAFDAILQLIPAGGGTPIAAQIFPVKETVWGSPRLGPINHRKGERLRVIARNAYTGEANASLFIEDSR